MKKIKIGFFVDKVYVNKNIFDLIQFVSSNQQFEKPEILIEKGSDKSVSKFTKLKKYLKNYGITKTINYLLYFILYKIIFFFEKRYVKKFFKDYSINKNLNELGLNKILLNNVSKKKNFLELDNLSISKIKNLNFDVLIRNNSKIIAGEVLNLTKYGILSFHHGDNRTNRGGPSGFWEVYNGESSSGFVLQKLNNQLDAGEIIMRGNIMTSKIWFLNSAYLAEKSKYFIKKVLLDIAYGKNISFETNQEITKKIYSHKNSPLILIKYIFKVYLKLIVKFLDNRFIRRRDTRWSVAFSKGFNINKSFNKYNEIENNKQSFFADPFVITFKQKTICFVEEFSKIQNKGKIAAIQLDDDKYNYLGVVLEENFHLSFPFIFISNNQIYMVPETSKIKEIRLYKCEKFPSKWSLVKILKKNVQAVDTMLIKKKENWFMLTNICSSGIKECNSELHIYYSKELISDNWNEIECGNPVIFDSTFARNGGLYSYKNQLVRISQNHGFDHYGKSFKFNLIKELNTKQYFETTISEIQPNFFNNINSTHHFHSDLKYTVIDYMRYERF